MKALILALAVVLIAGNLFAQAAPAPADGLAFNWSLGQDTAYLFTPGSKGAFLAVGGGVDIASYQKKLSGGGNMLALYLHGTLLAPVTGDNKKPIFGIAVNCDVLQLITGSPIKVLIKDLSLLVGPIAAYDTGGGKMAYGGIMNLNYKF